jgi:hypothetical protein
MKPAAHRTTPAAHSARPGRSQPRSSKHHPEGSHDSQRGQPHPQLTAKPPTPLSDSLPGILGQLAGSDELDGEVDLEQEADNIVHRESFLSFLFDICIFIEPFTDMSI